MIKTFSVVCPKCKVSYELESEYLNQEVECECGARFIAKKITTKALKKSFVLPSGSTVQKRRKKNNFTMLVAIIILALLGCILGYVFLGKGDLKDINYEIYNNHLVKAATNGDPKAQFSLAHCYAYSKGVTKDLEQSIFWMKHSANQGYGKAEEWLMYHYMTSDSFELFKWSSKVAAREDPFAIKLMGDCYKKGKGVSANVYKAFDCYKKASNKGLDLATVEVAKCYLSGDGVSKNVDEGLRMLKKMAASSGRKSVMAQRELALIYRFGIGVDENLETALDWAKKGFENPFANELDKRMSKSDIKYISNDLERKKELDKLEKRAKN